MDIAHRLYAPDTSRLHVLRMTLLSAFIISAVFTVGLISRRHWPCFDLEEFPTSPRQVVGVACLIAILAVTVFAPLLTFHRGGDTELDDISYAAMFLGHVLLSGFLLVWWGLLGFPPPREFFHFRSSGIGEQVRRGIVAGLVGWGITIVVMIAVGTVASLFEPPAETTADLPDVVRTIVDLSLARRIGLIVAAMVVEEVFFRSFLQTRCGLVLSSLMFAASHSNYGLPLMLVGVFSVSVVLGLLYRSTRSVLPCMIAHGVFDGVQLLFILPMVAGSS
jgi:membrane protease YdiL (CAAX protease family)